MLPGFWAAVLVTALLCPRAESVSWLSATRCTTSSSTTDRALMLQVPRLPLLVGLQHAIPAVDRHQHPHLCEPAALCLLGSTALLPGVRPQPGCSSCHGLACREAKQAQAALPHIHHLLTQCVPLQYAPQIFYAFGAGAGPFALHDARH